LSGLGADSRLTEDEPLELPSHYRDGALRLHGELSPVTGARAEELNAVLHTFERKQDQWDARPVSQSSNVMGFRFRSVGRVSNDTFYSRSCIQTKRYPDI
jgi:hypothetical protein